MGYSSYVGENALSEVRIAPVQRLGASWREAELILTRTFWKRPCPYAPTTPKTSSVVRHTREGRGRRSRETLTQSVGLTRGT
jgi:hypothetical protein